MHCNHVACDFCKSMFRGEDAGDKLVGIDRLNAKPRFIPVQDAKFHLCKPCLEGIGGLSRIAPAPLVHVPADLVPSYQWPSNFQAVSGSQAAHVKPRMKPQDV